MTNSDIEKAIELIYGAQKIGLITHVDGDGDAFGSMLAMDVALRELKKETVIFSNEELIELYDFVKNEIKYHPIDSYQKVDLLICLDFNNVERAVLPGIIEKAKKDAQILTIDHHPENSIGKISDVYLSNDVASSTSEMVFDVIRELGVAIDKPTANLLLMGIEVDTMSFSHATSPRTFEVVAELLRKGARIKPIVESAFQRKPVSTLKLWGRALERISFDEKSKSAFAYLTYQDLKELDLIDSVATTGIINFINQIKEPKIVALFTENTPGVFKVSLRTRDENIDVSKIAEKFDGGGHVKASSFKIEGTLPEVMEKVKERLTQ